VLSVEQALVQMQAGLRVIPESEELPTAQAGGRVLARPVMALVDVPPMDNAQMDGYAVRCADIARVPARLPVRLRIAAGQVPGELPAGAAARIFTGAPIPGGCDAIVMQEATRTDGDAVVVLEQPTPNQWIRRRGIDIARGTVALAAGQALRAQHLGIAASVGAARLGVVRRPRVALFSTGDELAMPGDAPAPGRIYNSNRYALSGLLLSLGCEITDLGIVPDTLAATRQALAQAAQGADLVLSSGGVSVGEEDHVKAALESLGSLQLWQIAMKPGKPLAFGHIGAVPFIGLPGNPVSSFVTFLIFVRPFILRLLGVPLTDPQAVLLRADFARPADPQRREFLRVRINAGGGLEPYPSQNSALLSSVAWAHGLADLPAGRVVTVGEPLRFLSFHELTGPP
jgi:molybdopterin molybdotransferase